MSFQTIKIFRRDFPAEIFSGRAGLLRDEGQSLVEYSLIIALIAIVIVVALTAFGAAIVPFITAIIPAL